MVTAASINTFVTFTRSPCEHGLSDLHKDVRLSVVRNEPEKVLKVEFRYWNRLRQEFVGCNGDPSRAR